MESETLILQTIRALANRGKTVIMVTHRMANAADADHVVVFERGRVANKARTLNSYVPMEHTPNCSRSNKPWKT